MPSKNDLSALKKTTQKPVILPSEKTPDLKSEKPKTMGRPPKDKSEKRSYKVTLSLTEAEGEKLVEQAGLASAPTFLYAKLKELNII